MRKSEPQIASPRNPTPDAKMLAMPGFTQMRLSSSRSKSSTSVIKEVIVLDENDTHVGVSKTPQKDYTRISLSVKKDKEDDF